MYKIIFFFSLTTLLLNHSVRAAGAGTNTENDYKGSAGGSLLTPGNWSLGSVPTVSQDATFTSASPTGTETLNSGNLTVGSLDVTAASGTYAVGVTTGSTNYTLTLGGAGDNGDKVSGTAADFLYAATGSTLNLGGSSGGTGTLLIALGTNGTFHASGTIGISAVISDGGSGYGVTKSGGGILILGGANTYSGGTTVNNGTLQLANAAGLTDTGTLGSTSGTLTVNTGGILDFTGTSQTVGNFTGTGGTILNSTNGTASTLTIGGGNGTGGTFAGVIEDHASGGTGTIALVKTGTGTITLTGTSTFSGGDTINQGVLTISSSSGLGAGAVTVNPTGTTGTSTDAATLNTTNSGIGNHGAIFTVNSNSASAVGTINFTSAAPVIGSLTGNGSVVLQNATGTQLTVGYTNNLSSTFAGVISEATAGEGQHHQGRHGQLHPHWGKYLHRYDNDWSRHAVSGERQWGRSDRNHPDPSQQHRHATDGRGQPVQCRQSCAAYTQRCDGRRDVQRQRQQPGQQDRQRCRHADLASRLDEQRRRLQQQGWRGHVCRLDVEWIDFDNQQLSHQQRYLPVVPTS